MDPKSLERMNEDLIKLTFAQNELGFNHLSYSEEVQVYRALRNGDMKCVQMGMDYFGSDRNGKLSEDPLRNAQYLFVSLITTCCRYCILGGMPPQEAYNLSDLYIQSADRCQAMDEVRDVVERMLTDYCKRMQAVNKQRAYSKPVMQAIEFIDKHMHERLTQEELSDAIGLSRTYFSTLFAKEVGMPITEYIRQRKVSSAKGLLAYFDYSILEIAEYFGFSSDSHFSSTFKKETGMTPREYRERYAFHHFGQ
ncbi:MAG: helix-turn-helix transcriptional regulator [Clostridia bacterium]|nr:helix-turn-helix transcriptional regulator [Clostridia bacterium]